MLKNVGFNKTCVSFKMSSGDVRLLSIAMSLLSMNCLAFQLKAALVVATGCPGASS